MYQEVKQTYKEKMSMYMKLQKRHLSEMLIECNKHLDILNKDGWVNEYEDQENKFKVIFISVCIGIIIGALLTIGALLIMTL